MEIILSVFFVDKWLNYFREKLMKLAEIHVSLEFLNLIQNHFDNCRWDISLKLFEAALKTYRGTKSPLEDNNIYTLSLPAPQSFIAEISKKYNENCLFIFLNY